MGRWVGGLVGRWLAKSKPSNVILCACHLWVIYPAKLEHYQKAVSSCLILRFSLHIEKLSLLDCILTGNIVLIQ